MQGQRPLKLDCEWVAQLGTKSLQETFRIISQFYLSFIWILSDWPDWTRLQWWGREGWALFNAMFVAGVPWYKFQYILIIILIVPHDEL